MRVCVCLCVSLTINANNRLQWKSNSAISLAVNSMTCLANPECGGPEYNASQWHDIAIMSIDLFDRSNFRFGYMTLLKCVFEQEY